MTSHGGKIEHLGELLRQKELTDIIFDLDGTLYPTAIEVEFQIRPKVREHAMRLLGLPESEIRQILVRGRKQYGSGVLALREEFGIDPVAFLNVVYSEIDRSRLPCNPRLIDQFAVVSSLCRLHLLTNSNQLHAEDILARMRLASYFTSVNSVETTGFRLKPHRGAYESVIKRNVLPAATTLVFDDSYLNLDTARGFGAYTALVSNGVSQAPLFWEMHKQEEHEAPEWVDVYTHDLPGLLALLTSTDGGSDA